MRTCCELIGLRIHRDSGWVEDVYAYCPEHYSRLASWRTTDPGQRAKAMRVEKPPVQIDGQYDMFGDVA